MNTVQFGKTGDEVSILGYGTMRFPVQEGDNERIDVPTAVAQLRHAIDLGVTYIDTAWPYHGGHSEEVVGQALRDGYRERVRIASKCPSWLIESAEDIEAYLDRQREKLGVETIDYYLLHALNARYWKKYQELPVFEVLERARRAGKIRQIGFSFHDELPLFKEIVDAYDWDFCQIQYNLVDEDYQAGREGLSYAHKRGLSVVIMEPLRGGSLVNAIPSDVRAIWDRAPERSPAGWSLAWLWNQPGVDVVLSGMNSIEQIEENVRVASESHTGCLGEDECAMIEEVRDIYLARTKVGCTACRYCMPCPVGIDIPGHFEFYNQGSMFDNWDQAQEQFRIFVPESAFATHCIRCGQCVEACPQNIEVPDRLVDALAALGVES